MGFSTQQQLLNFPHSPAPSTALHSEIAKASGSPSATNHRDLGPPAYKLGSITFASSQAAFEIDQIYSAARCTAVSREGWPGAFHEGKYTLSLVNIEVLSLLVGSLDTYNSVILRNTDGSIFKKFEGSSLAGLTGTGQSGRVTYDFQGN